VAQHRYRFRLAFVSTIIALSLPSRSLATPFKNAMDDDTSDILGGPTLPVPRNAKPGSFSGLSVFLVIPVALFLFVVGARIWERFQIWREKSYKLCVVVLLISQLFLNFRRVSFSAMRRRHGIPDNDHRPFNVAYAAVVRARQEEEAASRRAKLDRLLGDDQRVAQPNQAVKQNQGVIISNCLSFFRDLITIVHIAGGLQKVNGKRPITIPGRFDFSGDSHAFSSSVLTYVQPPVFLQHFPDFPLSIVNNHPHIHYFKIDTTPTLSYLPPNPSWRLRLPNLGHLVEATANF
jgi:hypothetical protein